MTIDEIMNLRAQVWDEHPLITETAILPTFAGKDVVARVWEVARKGRASIAFFAQPLSGKSTCTRLIAAEMKRKKPGCGVMVYEAAEDDRPAEGRLISDILNKMNYAPKIASDLAGKRTQLHRALLAMSGESRHLFLIFDEAQDLSCREFAALKSVINRLVRELVKVTVVLFGQVELKEKKKQLKAARSDLEKRFMAELLEFKGIQNAAELEPLLAAIDTRSEFPTGSGLSYLHLLLPRFYEGGGRLAGCGNLFWHELQQRRLPGIGTVVDMSSVASFLASLVIHLRNLDCADLKNTPELLRQIHVV
ncbi:AAA family ATPase [uncultured Pseudoxanthomonas sp.]|uniref:AAA family ATPase n=1 Tax=uncultured Pseudoxanthomonas sp. TaxID=281701 RepID=UPI00262C2C70|nr:AAA family ATPase [uncultured Pseudoxanthomonas sp.]